MIFRELLRRAKGFTLIELLVVIAITGVLSTFTASILLSIYRGNQTVEAVNEIKQNSDYTHTQLEYAIRSAKAVTGSYPGNTLTVQDRDGNNTTFSINASNQLTRQVNAGTVQPLTSNKVTVSSLNFEVPDINGKPAVVRIGMTISSGTTPPMSLDFKTIVLARNY